MYVSCNLCILCGQKEHSPPCQSSPHCINCDGPHGSNSRDCPKFQMEREVQKIRATYKMSFPEAQRRYQAHHPVYFSRNFVSVLKSSKSTTTSYRTRRLPRRSVNCQITLTSIIGDQDKHPHLLKIITPTVKPTAEPQGAEPSSSSALFSTDNLTSACSCERPPRRTTYQPNRLARVHVPNRDPLLGTQQLVVTLLIVTQMIRRALRVAHVRS